MKQQNDFETDAAAEKTQSEQDRGRKREGPSTNQVETINENHYEKKNDYKAAICKHFQKITSIK